MKKLTATLFLLVSTMGFLLAQTQVIKGIITDKQSEMPLIGATVQLIGAENAAGAVSDIDGYYRLEGVPVGRQNLQINYLGYSPLTIPNVLVSSGKEVILDIALEESVEELTEVVVTASTQKDKAQNELATISARTFSLEEVNRYSGGGNDVARLAGNFAGVSTADDSRNDIVIRGNSPTGVLWRLEGIPVPNPNHFSTLGTTGGPVSALNPNLLRNSDFLTSAFPSEYGNALAGVFDLGFRNGNRDRHEFMFQMAAFSGLEAMAEGPISKANGSNYIIAARYSLVGLIGGAGTNAVPNYSDIAFKVNLGKSKLGRFTLFGIGGTSDIDFLHDEIDEDDLFAAPDEDLYAESQFGVAGLKHNLILDEKSYLRTVVAFSTSRGSFQNDRIRNLDTEEEEIFRIATNDNIENRLSFSTLYNRKFNAKLTTRIGLLAENFQYDVEFLDREDRPDRDGDGIEDWVTLYDFEEGMTILQAFAQAQYKINSDWTLNFGLHSQSLTLNNSFALEPRAAINWKVAPKHTLSVGYGLHHQTQPLPILLLQEETSPNVFESTNQDLDFTRSHHFVLGYDLALASDWRAKVETYYQAVRNVPVEPNPSSFSMLNVGDDFGFPDDVFGLQNDGEGANYGFELTVEKFFSKGYYGLLTASIFESTYKGSDGVERNTAFNNGYVFNFLAGKEWKIGKDKRNAFSIDTKFTTAGGNYYTPVDLEASQKVGTEVLIDDEAYSKRFPAYLRWDVKMGVKLNSNKRKLSHQFFVDLRNVTNRENIFARRYNRVTNEVNEVNQQMFFPDFLYRLEF
ncbi:MAG: TonB-dependent receptor [Bacteroidota bacterium]